MAMINIRVRLNCGSDIVRFYNPDNGLKHLQPWLGELWEGNRPSYNKVKTYIQHYWTVLYKIKSELKYRKLNNMLKS